MQDTSNFPSWVRAAQARGLRIDLVRLGQLTELIPEADRRAKARRSAQYSARKVGADSIFRSTVARSVPASFLSVFPNGFARELWPAFSAIDEQCDIVRLSWHAHELVWAAKLTQDDKLLDLCDRTHEGVSLIKLISQEMRLPPQMTTELVFSWFYGRGGSADRELSLLFPRLDSKLSKSLRAQVHLKMSQELSSTAAWFHSKGRMIVAARGSDLYFEVPTSEDLFAAPAATGRGFQRIVITRGRTLAL